MRALLFFVAMVFLTTQPAQAVVTFFNDQSAFDTATSGLLFTTDDFSTDVPSATEIVFDSGVTSRNSGGRPVASVDNVVFSGRYLNALDGNGVVASTSIIWTFPEPVIAVGLQYRALLSDVLNVLVDGTMRAVREGADSDPANGFFGFTTTVPVTQITFTNPTSSFDSFEITDLQFSAAPAVVPLPGALPFLLAGLAGLALVRVHGRQA
ncbi:MAG: hypothetical protein AAFQ81_01480 [Pseudomonadota bacterium]